MLHIHSWELSLIQALHTFRTPGWDRFFHFLNYFDRPEFMLVLVPIIWLCISWKWGMRIVCLGLLSQFMIIALKGFFSLPRPYFLDPQLAVLEVKGFGFPSGAAQSTVLFGGLLISQWKSKWAWLISGNYFFWVSLSRVYLGVHFFSDLLGGWLSGGIMLWVFLRFSPALEKVIKSCSMKVLFPLFQIFAILFMMLKPTVFTIRLTSISLGLGIGIWMSKKYGFYLSSPKNAVDIFLRCFIGIGGTFLTVFMIENVAAYLKIDDFNTLIFIKFFAAALWNSLGASWLLSRYLYRFKKSLA